MHNCLVTVFCLAYNHEKYIRTTFEGFVKQKTTFKFKVLVHDDASYYRCLGDFGDAISHGLKPLEVFPKCFIALSPDGYEVPRLRRLVREGLEFDDESPTEVNPIINAMS